MAHLPQAAAISAQDVKLMATVTALTVRQALFASTPAPGGEVSIEAPVGGCRGA